MALSGRTAAVFGIVSQRSIGWAVATELQRQGASVALGIQSDRFADRVRRLVDEHWERPAAAVLECDVSSDDQVAAAGQALASAFPHGLGTLVHSIAFAPAAAMRGRLVDCAREDWAIAHDVSAYSLIALTRATLPSLRRAAEAGAGASVLAMTYLGSTRAVPAYSVMGPAKASLEATARGLAAELGAEGVRVNCVSPGTVNTPAARGIPGFSELHAAVSEAVPGPRVPTAEDAGRLAAFLASDAAAGIHGQTLYVDGGVSAMALPGHTKRA